MNASSWKVFMKKASVYVQQQCFCVHVYKASIVVLLLVASCCMEKRKMSSSFLNISHTLFHPCSLGHYEELYLNK